MAGFKFNLQPVLNLKIQLEDKLKNELGKAMQELEKQKAALARLEDEKEDCIRQFREKSSRGIKVSRLKSINDYISVLNDKIANQKENVNYARNIVDKVREDLIKMVREREILDKLKEKKYRAYLDEQLKEEQKLNDEIVSYKHGGSKTAD